LFESYVLILSDHHFRHTQTSAKPPYITDMGNKTQAVVQLNWVNEY